MGWEVAARNGIFLPQIQWHLDAPFPTGRAYLSHPHFDHMAAHARILCSAATARLAQMRLGGQSVWDVRPCGQPFEIAAGAQAELFPSGHLIGSTQLRLRGEGETLLYTGDFKPREPGSPLVCATPSADLLIMETTYGLPKYVFPDTARILADIRDFCADCLQDGHTPVLFGYSLGKSQALLQELAREGVPIMLHREAFRLTEACREFATDLPACSLFDAATCQGHIVIAPPQAPDSAWLRKVPSPKTAMMTGWAVDPAAAYRYRCDRLFPLSDHADFLELIEFVEKVRPSRVLTTHGYAREFAETLRERGYEAWALGQENQMGLRLTVPSPTSKAPDAESDAPPDEEPKAPAHSFEAFVRLLESLESRPSPSARRKILADYLASMDSQQAALALEFLAMDLPPFARQREPLVDADLLKMAALQAFDIPESALRAAYRSTRDLSQALASLAPTRRAAPSLDLAKARSMTRALREASSPAFRLSFLQSELKRLSATELKWMSRILTARLRLKLAPQDLAHALADLLATEAMDLVDAYHRGSEWPAIFEAAHAGRLRQLQLQVFTPLPPMPCPRAAKPQELESWMGEEVWAEEKFDGLRVLLHKLDERVDLFDAQGRRRTVSFPEIAEAARELPQDFVAEGCIVAWRNERPAPSDDLRSRLDQAAEELFPGEETPAILWLYDLLWSRGSEVLRRPLAERRDTLEGFSFNTAIRLAPTLPARDLLELEMRAQQAVARGHRGVVLKRTDAAYTLARESGAQIAFEP